MAKANMMSPNCLIAAVVTETFFVVKTTPYVIVDLF